MKTSKEILKIETRYGYVIITQEKNKHFDTVRILNKLDKAIGEHSINYILDYTKT